MNAHTVHIDNCNDKNINNKTEVSYMNCVERSEIRSALHKQLQHFRKSMSRSSSYSRSQKKKAKYQTRTRAAIENAGPPGHNYCNWKAQVKESMEVRDL